MKNIRIKKNLIYALAILTLAVLSLAALAWPIMAWAEESETHGMGYLESEAEINYVNNAGPLLMSGQHASKYDPREEDWYKNNIVVKNQKSTGLCWAFSTTTAAEISYLKESGTYVGELSPGHLGYFAYNRSSSLSDPLGNTSGDSTCVNSSKTWYNVGGTAEYALQVLANWLGLANETTASTSWISSPASFAGYDNSLAYKDTLVLENAELLNNDDGNSIDTIKSLIEEYGAVTCAIADPGNKKDCISAGDEYAMYSSSSPAAHAVTIIGWDDDYSSSNFMQSPEGDGAWLIQNSWGTGSYNKPYIWVSYYDASVNDTIAAFDMAEKDDDMYCFQYDGGISAGSAYMEKGSQAASIYKVPDDATYYLGSVGFTEWNEGYLEYTVRVYTDLKDSTNPSSGTLAASKTVTTEYSGYHSFELDDEVALEPGTSYSIVIEFTAKTSMGLDKTSVESNIIRSVVTASSGQSFYKNSGASKWSDASKMTSPATFRIKGIATKADKGLRVTTEGYSGSNLKLVLTDSNGSSFTAKKSPYLFCEMSNGAYSLEVSADGDFVTREYSGILSSDYEELSTEIRELGDANCDGERTAEDVTAIARHIAKISIEDDAYTLKLFDTDKSGKDADATDVTHLARYIAKIITEL